MIKVGDRKLEGTISTRLSDTAWSGRESKAVTVWMSYSEAIALFTDGLVWSTVSSVPDGAGTYHDVEVDMSEYSISGPITDNRDGTVTIRMGKYTEAELMNVPLAVVPKNHTEANHMRRIIESAVQYVDDDDDALVIKSLYPDWAHLAETGASAAAGMRFRHGDGLYKVLTAHAFAAHWIPGAGTESLYARIDETHAGTAVDPIPYSGNMELFDGLHYEQDGVVYVCVRDTGIAVHNTLSDLVGLYVQVMDV